MGVRLVDLLCVSSYPAILERLSDYFGPLDIQAVFVKSVEEFLSSLNEKECRVKVSIFSFNNGDDFNGLKKQVEILRTRDPRTQFMVLFDDGCGDGILNSVKELEFSHCFSFSELEQRASRLSYSVVQALRGRKGPIRLSELPPIENANCDLFYFLPLNRKFIPIVGEGGSLTPQKLDKLRDVKEIFVDLNDSAKFAKTAQNYPEPEVGLIRAAFLEVQNLHCQLVHRLTDQMMRCDPAELADLIERATKLVQDLVAKLSHRPDVWDMMSFSSRGFVCVLDRAPVTAVLAAHLGRQRGLEHLEDLIKGALFMDIGMLRVSQSTLLQLHQEGYQKLSKQKIAEYELHPQWSIDICSQNGVELSENVQRIIRETHQKVGTGRDISPAESVAKIEVPLESRLLNVAQAIDQAVLEGIDIHQARKVFESQLSAGETISENFLARGWGRL
ncbi:MAG: hypothetical protein N2578_00625 [Bdellovibrionaceae bacterium]|nr:hypothetical protein [Pseudobdellovibrionaceae bacterium]